MVSTFRCKFIYLSTTFFPINIIARRISTNLYKYYSIIYLISRFRVVLQTIAKEIKADLYDVKRKCENCDNIGENWICLVCQRYGLEARAWSKVFTKFLKSFIYINVCCKHFFYYFRVFCSRYVQEHMLFHSIESQHLVTLSFSDISVWCYACEDYVSIYHFL